MVTDVGGIGIAVRVDHAQEKEVGALFARVKGEQKKVDVVVNVLSGYSVTDWQSFWKLPLDKGREMVESWVWPHVMTSRHAAPLMVKAKSGLIVGITEGHTIEYRSQLFYDLAVTTIKRLAFALSEEMSAHGVSAVAITPGFMRTEAVLDQFGTDAERWRDIVQTNAQARQFGLAGSESPCFIGRAIAALAADPHVARKSGGLYSSWELSDEYGFTDADGARPHWGRYVEANFPHLHGTPDHGRAQWRIMAHA